MSSNGIKTSFWGPHAWSFLFSSIAGSYPVKIDSKNKEHLRIMKSYQNMFLSLQHTLPCSFCRDSYKQYLKDLPIANYSGSRLSMMKWLYLIHDKVNQKLMKQEKQKYEKARDRLSAQMLSPEKKKKALKELKTSTLKTKPSPSFDKVLATYEKQRARS